MITGLIIVLATVVIAVLITFGIAYYGYREAFYYKDERTNEERWQIPKGEQYKKEADNMRSLIENLAAKDERMQKADLILSSPYTRALQTAAILSKELGAEIIIETDLHEIIVQ